MQIFFERNNYETLQKAITNTKYHPHSAKNYGQHLVLVHFQKSPSLVKKACDLSGLI